MNKQEMKVLALSKVQDKVNEIIAKINNDIRESASNGKFVLEINSSEIGYAIMSIVLEDFNYRGFTTEQFIEGNPIVVISWFRK